MEINEQSDYNFHHPVAPRVCRGDGSGVCDNNTKPQLNTSSLSKNQICKQIYLIG